jgi:hypothetical protein
MRIHTLEDAVYELNELPEEIDDMRFAIFDNSNPKDPDYFYIPLIYLESYFSPALVLKIGDAIIKMPADWQILTGEEEFGDLEALPLTSLNNRDFTVFEYNSLSSTRAEFLPIEIIDIYNEVLWYTPKLNNGQFLAVPIDSGDKPRVVYFAKEVSRNCEVVDYNKAW